MGGKWNFDDQMEFLHGQMMNVVIPKVAAARAAMGEQTNGHQEWNERPPDDDPYRDAPPVDDDDIPF